MRAELEIMLKSYDYLRQEIVNSISWQSRFIMAVVTVIPALLGLGLTQEDFSFLIVAIPPAVIALTAFWLVEQTRMMRAGDYLQLLEDEINFMARGAYILWENWLRIGMPGLIHGIHHWSQHLGAFGVFYVVSLFSLWKLGDEWKLGNSLELANPQLWLWVLYFVMLHVLLVFLLLVVPHRSRSRDQFVQWRNAKYLGERLGRPPVS